jgi:iron(III) transport system ATP-binding protein
VAVRPDAVRLTDGAAGLQMSLKSNVTHATYLGSAMHYTVQCDVGDLFVIDGRIDAPITQAVPLALDFRRGVLRLYRVNDPQSEKGK